MEVTDTTLQRHTRMHNTLYHIQTKVCTHTHVYKQVYLTEVIV